jgi:hypothetical protein
MARKAVNELDPNGTPSWNTNYRWRAIWHLRSSRRVTLSGWITLARSIHKPLGEFWIDIARQVITHVAKSGGQPNFSATIQ